MVRCPQNRRIVIRALCHVAERIGRHGGRAARASRGFHGGDRGGIGRIDAVEGRRDAAALIVVIAEADQIGVHRVRPILGGVPPNSAVDDGGGAVGKRRAHRIDRALRRAVRSEKDIVHRAPRAPEQQAAVFAHLHELRREDLRIGLVRQKAHLRRGIGEVPLRHSGNEHIALAFVQIDVSGLLVNAAARNEIVRGRDGEAAEIRAGLVAAASERQNVNALAAEIRSIVKVGQEFSACVDRLMAIEKAASRVMCVAVVERDEPVSVEREKLIEGMADIAVFRIHRSAAHVGDGHVALAHAEGEVRLMSGIHLVRSVEIQIRAVLRHAKAAGIKRHLRIRAAQADAVQPQPRFGITHNADDLRGVAAARVFLAEDDEVRASTGEKAAEDRKLDRDLLLADDLAVHRVLLRHEPRAGRARNILHALHALPAGMKIGPDRTGPEAEDAGAVVIALILHVAGQRRRQRSLRRQHEQAAKQRRQQQRKRSLFHADTPLLGQNSDIV